MDTLQLIYIPCIVAMAQVNTGCYRIMIALGINDLLAVFVGCLLSGYFSITGISFCTNPVLVYVIGHIAQGYWLTISCLYEIQLSTQNLMSEI